jgi:hypothetical protein
MRHIAPEDVDAWVDAWVTCALHVVRSPYWYRTPCRGWPFRFLLDSIQQFDLPPERVIRKVVEWSLFDVEWNALFGQSTEYDRVLAVAARRLAASLPRIH